MRCNKKLEIRMNNLVSHVSLIVSHGDIDDLCAYKEKDYVIARLKDIVKNFASKTKDLQEIIDKQTSTIRSLELRLKNLKRR